MSDATAPEPSGDATDSPDSAGPSGDGATAAPAVRTRPVWTMLASPFGAGFFLTLGGLVALVLGLAVANLSTVIIYIAFALFAALGLDPIVRFLERRGLSRAWSIVIVFAGFAIVIAAVLGLVLPTVVQQIAQFITAVPNLVTTFTQSDVYAWLQSTFGASVPDLVGELQKFVTNPANIAAIGGGVLQVGFSIATGISGAIIVLVLSLYFLASLPTIKTAFLRVVPARNRPGVGSITDEITDSVGGYLMGMVILAFLNAVATFLLYFFLQLPFPALFAVISFCITIIPLVGPVLFWIIGSVFAVFADPMAALIFAAIYLAYMQIEAYVLTPRVMNRTISVPGSLVVIGALVGGTLLGLLGALVAIPVTASILLIIKQVVVPRQDAKV
jgi:predicted PurR-regulated permease PerM